MPILHLADRLTERGGAYLHLLGLVEAQAREHDVHLAAGRDDEGVPAACATSVVEGLGARAAAHVELGPLLARVRPDVVYAHNVVNPEALETVGGLDGPEKIAVVQDHRFFCPGKGKWTADDRVCDEAMSRELCAGCFSDEGYFEEIYDLTAARLRALASFRVEVLSEYVKRELVTAGLDEARVRVVRPLAPELDPSAEPDGERCVLFVGRLVEAKGVRDAVEAWRRSEVELPLVFAGTGPLRGELERAGFEVTGWVPRDRMASLYRRAACVLMPSRWQEPFGIAGLEAQAMGTPVVAWESGGIPEWSPEARRVPWGDVGALARELKARCAARVIP